MNKEEVHPKIIKNGKKVHYQINPFIT